MTRFSGQKATTSQPREWWGGVGDRGSLDRRQMEGKGYVVGCANDKWQLPVVLEPSLSWDLGNLNGNLGIHHI